ncbi:MAG: hypothetical protein AAFQ16_04650, partial [Pseudomonadota bacterium]
FISLQSNNFEGVDTTGIDLSVEYRLTTDATGDFTFGVEAAHVLSYEQQIFADDPVVDLAGEIGTPDTRINPYFNWRYGDFTVGGTGRYISGHGENVGGQELNIASHFELDLQATYSLPWDGLVTVGMQNVLDEEPEQAGELIYGWEPFDFSLYPNAILGPVPYVRYQQNF